MSWFAMLREVSNDSATILYASHNAFVSGSAVNSCQTDPTQMKLHWGGD